MSTAQHRRSQIPRARTRGRRRAAPQSGEVCIANISPSERRKRLTFGVVQLIIGLAILALLITTDASRWWRLGLLLIFWSAALGFFQWRDKTCIALVARNAQDRRPHRADRGCGRAGQVRRQARRVQLKALVAGVLITLVALALPL